MAVVVMILIQGYEIVSKHQASKDPPAPVSKFSEVMGVTPWKVDSKTFRVNFGIDNPYTSVDICCCLENQRDRSCAR
jgi:hypothetical protein